VPHTGDPEHRQPANTTEEGRSCVISGMTHLRRRTFTMS
jgi:hypothetical protein